MTTKGRLTREQAVEIVGEAAVDAAERKNCEQTGRFCYNGACQGDDWCEWRSSVDGIDKDGIDCAVSVYYYTSNQQDALMAETGDSGVNDWMIEGYAVDY